MATKSLYRHRVKGGSVIIPHDVAECPECGDTLIAEAYEWRIETGAPTQAGIHVSCANQCEPHDWWQSSWQRTLEKVYSHVEAVD